MAKGRLHITEKLLTSLEARQAILKACEQKGALLCPIDDPFVCLEQLHPRDFLVLDPWSLALLIKNKGYKPNKQLILMTSQPNNGALKEIHASLQGLHYVIGTSCPHLIEKLFARILQQQNPPVKETLFLNSFSQSPEFKHANAQLDHSKERVSIQETVSEFFMSQVLLHKKNMAPGSSVHAKNLADILDEFLMNAIWDANPARKTLSRNEPVSLTETERVDIDFACDGKNLCLTVTDPFGNMTLDALQKPLLYALGLINTAQIRENTAGAGIGFFMILQRVEILLVEVIRGKMSRMTAIARGDHTLKAMQKSAKSILFLD